VKKNKKGEESQKFEGPSVNYVFGTPSLPREAHLYVLYPLCPGITLRQKPSLIYSLFEIYEQPLRGKFFTPTLRNYRWKDILQDYSNKKENIIPLLGGAITKI
jgi:hypothetical protein